MNFLLDTHVLLWWLREPNRIRSPLRRRISQAQTIYVSAVSVWEAHIKSALGKLELPERFAGLLDEEGFVELPILIHHAEAVSDLPMIHKDPFDRLLIAQAQCEGLALISSDARFKAYPIDVVWS